MSYEYEYIKATLNHLTLFAHVAALQKKNINLTEKKASLHGWLITAKTETVES